MIKSLVAKPRKKYKTRSKGRVTDKTLKDEAIVLKDMILKYFGKKFSKPFVTNLINSAHFFYDKNARNVAVHAWRKSITRKTFIVSCIYTSFRSQFEAAIEAAIKTGGGSGTGSEAGGETGSEIESGTVVKRSDCMLILIRFIKSEGIPIKKMMQYMNIHKHSRQYSESI